MSEESKYRQLGLFSVIIAEVVITPCLLGGLAYWLLKNTAWQILGAVIAAVLGLVIAFYRISLLKKTMDRA